MTHDTQLELGIRTSARPLRLSRDLRNVPLNRYRLPKDGRKWKTVARERMALAEWLATHGDADGSRIYPSEKSMSRHFGWSRRKTFYLLADLAELNLLVSDGRLTSEHGTRVRRINLSAFLGPGVQDSSRREVQSAVAAGVQDSRAGVPGVQDSRAAGVQDSGPGVHSNVAHNRHQTGQTCPPNPPTESVGGNRPPRVRRLTRAQIEARVGSGPTIAESPECAICGHTENFHKKMLVNKLRFNPKWIEHEYVSPVAVKTEDFIADTFGALAPTRVSAKSIKSRDKEKSSAGGAAQGNPVDNLQELKAKLRSIAGKNSIVRPKPKLEPTDAQKLARVELLHQQARDLGKKVPCENENNCEVALRAAAGGRGG